jgi:glutathione synthase/RimK-type ligase-like ATP-grasp enzyme
VLTTNVNGNTSGYINFTEEISEETLEGISDFFFYSLFQEKLNKEIDVRTFFLNEECYSMAIFSQLEIQTSVDFRKYSNNRKVPYRLPKEVEDKIRKLMHALELNIGCLDIVKTKDGRYVFLEVNPVGQYDMNSVLCNYQLDKKIAEFLCHDNKQQ